MFFQTPEWVKKQWLHYNSVYEIPGEIVEEIRLGLYKYNIEKPEISVVIPAYNEENGILRTLYSFSKMNVSVPTELIFVDNHSTDETAMILKRCQAKFIYEGQPGIPFARQAGLKAAKGKIVLCGDSDSIYPANWINTMYNAFLDENIVAAYGYHSFVPVDQDFRIKYSLYETAAKLATKIRENKRIYLNAMGASLAFRREAALKAGGFDPEALRGSDGRLVKNLMKYGKVKPVPHNDARVWTDPRRLNKNRSFLAYFAGRLNRELKQIREYL